MEPHVKSDAFKQASTTLKAEISSEMRRVCDRLGVELQGGGAVSQAEVARFSVRPLQEFQVWCDYTQRSAQNPSDRFLLFFFSTFFHDVFYNLIGDFPYHPEAVRLRQEFFHDMLDKLNECSEFMSEKDIAPLHVCERMVDAYLRAVAKINKEGFGDDVK